MKKIFSVLLALLILSLAAPAFARPVESELYVADLPGRWQFAENDDITTFVSPERNCVFIITAGLSVNAHKNKVAGVVAEYDRIVKGNPDRHVTVTRVHGVRIVVTILGDHPDRVSIYYSIKLKDEQAVPYR